MNTYTIPAMTTEPAIKWAEVLDQRTLQNIADWCESAADCLRREAHWNESEGRGALIADCSRFELTAAHLRGLIKTIEA